MQRYESLLASMAHELELALADRHVLMGKVLGDCHGADMANGEDFPLGCFADTNLPDDGTVRRTPSPEKALLTPGGLPVLLEQPELENINCVANLGHHALSSSDSK